MDGVQGNNNVIPEIVNYYKIMELMHMYAYLILLRHLTEDGSFLMILNATHYYLC